MSASPEAKANLRVLTPAGSHVFAVPVGTAVRDALDATELRVRAACGGTGACGACAVTLLGGTVNPPTLAEIMKLPPDERAAGARLACQLRLAGDAEIRIEDPAPPSRWMSIAAENLRPAPGALTELRERIYGVAVDLGTTHIRLSLWDRKRGRRIATRRGPNPQAIHGADVLNRLAAAAARPERAAELARLARAAIVQAVRDILARDVGEVTPMLNEIGAVFVVGNTAMLALLSGRGAAELLDPAHWERRIDCRPADMAAFCADWFMPHAEFMLPAPVAGFIGSDLIADLVATGIAREPGGALLLDVGTNTEIALWDGRRLLATAVPGGPAFEGVGPKNGMAAEPGAICRVRADGECFACETIAGSPARGICGSGLVDAVAALRATGRLKPSGRFVRPPGADGFRLDPANPRTALASRDIDEFQRAKAATAAAMEALLERAGMRWGDIGRLCVCGAFGHTLDVANAQAVGLLPQLDAARIELAADACLAGCEAGLLNPHGERDFAALAGRVEVINLSLVSGYDESYINHLRLLPFGS